MYEYTCSDYAYRRGHWRTLPRTLCVGRLRTVAAALATTVRVSRLAPSRSCGTASSASCSSGPAVSSTPDSSARRYAHLSICGNAGRSTSIASRMFAEAASCDFAWHSCRQPLSRSRAKWRRRYVRRPLDSIVHMCVARASWMCCRTWRRCSPTSSTISALAGCCDVSLWWSRKTHSAPNKSSCSRSRLGRKQRTRPACRPCSRTCSCRIGGVPIAVHTVALTIGWTLSPVSPSRWRHVPARWLRGVSSWLT